MLVPIQACSSAQRKQLFLDIQRQSPNPLPETAVTQLLLDMPIRWSSTYDMIDQVEKKKKVSGSALYLIVARSVLQYVDTFVFELGVHHPEKCDQIVQIKLTVLQLLLFPFIKHFHCSPFISSSLILLSLLRHPSPLMSSLALITQFQLLTVSFIFFLIL